MAESKQTPPLLIPETEARRLLGGVCSKTLYNLRCKGLPHVKIGERTMYDPGDLAQWVRERKRYTVTPNNHREEST